MARATRTTKTTKKPRKLKPKTHGIDFIMLFCVIMLLIFGTVMVFSASTYSAFVRHGDAFYFVRPQFMWMTLGLFGLIVMASIDYRRLKKFAVIGYVVSIVLLILVLIPFIGIEVNGARRWLGFGALRFQPSELSKITLIIFMAFFLSRYREILNKYKGFLLCLAIVVLPTFLILLENLSTAIVVVAIGSSIIFLMTPKQWHFLPMAIPGVIGVAAGVLLFPHRIARIQSWLDPFADPLGGGFQTVQSLLAIGSGGLFGLGLGNSRQKQGFIPESHNDIIFSIVCEELGLVGAALLLCLFAVLIWRILKTAMASTDLFGCIVSYGAAIMIGVQVLINVAVVTNTIPNTGMPLPFISYGGSSLTLLLGLMGIVLSVSRYNKEY